MHIQILSMKETLLFVFCVISSMISYPQTQIKRITADINANTKVDVLIPTDSSIIINIDSAISEIPMESFGFESLRKLNFNNNIITISGGNSGTGAFTWTYKFRYNPGKEKIELIGFDSFSKWVSGSITKSVNLLTDEYEIKLNEFNHEKNKMEMSRYNGKSKFSMIFLTEIRESSFDTLNELGQQYAPR